MEPDREHIAAVIEPILKVEGYDLIELEVKGSHAAPLIRLFIDRDGGINIQECMRISRLISDMMENSPGTGISNFSLEVSSPGVDRILKSVRDFERNVGREVAISVEQGEVREEVVGTILRAEDAVVDIQTGDSIRHLEYPTIVKATIRLKWK